jgi:hypothetical protein
LLCFCLFLFCFCFCLLFIYCIVHSNLYRTFIVFNITLVLRDKHSEKDVAFTTLH